MPVWAYRPLGALYQVGINTVKKFDNCLNYFGVSGNSYSFKCFTMSAEISDAIFFTVFSGASFSMTNFAAAT